jgi:AcrR family transcriptional regulator
MNLWERNKEERRKRILHAAAELLAREGLSGLSMRKLASQAEVSVATLYNLFAGREDILWTVVADRFAKLGCALAEVPQDLPIERMCAIVTATARHLESDERLGRPVVLAAMEHGPGPGAPALFVGAAFIDAIREAVASGLLTDDLDPDVLGGYMMLSYLQAMQGWARGFLSSNSFEAIVLYGLYQALLGAASAVHRPMFLAQLKRFEPQVGDLQRALFLRQQSAQPSSA